MDRLTRSSRVSSALALSALGLLGLAGTCSAAASPAAGLRTAALPRYFAPAEEMGKFRLHGAGVDAEFGTDYVRMHTPAGVFVIHFLGADPDVLLEGIDPRPGRIHILRAEGSALSGAATFGGVRYRGLYPGIDLEYVSEGDELESRFLLAPGADPGRIRLQYECAGRPATDPDGSLVIRTASGEMRESALAGYQEHARGRTHVAAAFAISEGDIVSFRLGGFDTGRPLIIDPTITYSSYLGGSAFDSITAVAVDPAGNIYLTGWTESPDFPLKNPLQPANRGGVDAFVAKFDPAGKNLLYCTYLGGSWQDRGMAIAVDSQGNAYVAGDTYSPDFPITANAAQIRLGGGRDAFVAKLSPAGDRLIFSTYLGGPGSDGATGIALDSAGHVFVAGDTASLD